MDSFYYNGGYVKIFNFDYKSCVLGTMQSYNWKWVEGAGLDFGLYSLMMENLPYGILEFQYMCYNDTAYYLSPAWADSIVNTCPFWLGDNEVEQATKVVIYPNPTFLQ